MMKKMNQDCKTFKAPLWKGILLGLFPVSEVMPTMESITGLAKIERGDAEMHSQYCFYSGSWLKSLHDH